MTAAISPSGSPGVPTVCQDAAAPRLCGIHFHFRHSQDIKERMGYHRKVYAYYPERHPNRRALALTTWVARHTDWRKRLSAYLAAPWLHWTGGMCIHSKEGSWTAYNPAGYYGGMQMDWSFMRRWGGWALTKYGGRDARSWVPGDQLHVAWTAYVHIGYGPWPNTARACGLL